MNTGARSQKSYPSKCGISILATANVAGLSHAIVMITWAILKVVDAILPAITIKPAANQYLSSAPGVFSAEQRYRRLFSKNRKSGEKFLIAGSMGYWEAITARLRTFS